MINKYCIKCGSEIWARARFCEKCHAPVIEVPKSQAQQATIKRIEEIQKENPSKKGQGCLATLIIFFVMFGIPALVVYSGIEIDSFLSLAIFSLVLLILNVVIYRYRCNLNFKQEKVFNLTLKDSNYFMGKERLCSKCNQLLTDDMLFCPKCARPTGEDIPIDLTLQNKPHQGESAIQNKLETNETGINYCTNCGSLVTDKKFCGECGTKVGE